MALFLFYIFFLKERKMKFISFEDETANQELAIDAAGADSMEADLVEGVFLNSNIESGVKSIEQTMDDAEQLEKHIELLTKACSEDSVDELVVKSSQISIEAICEKIGLNTSRTGISLESYKNETPKDTVKRIVISCENILTTIWEAVVNAVKKLIEWVKGFFSWVFGTNKKVSERIKTLEANEEKLAQKPSSEPEKPNTEAPAEKVNNKVNGKGISDILNIKSFSEYDNDRNQITIIMDADKFIKEKRDLISSLVNNADASLSSIEGKFSIRGGKGDKVSWPSSDGFSWYKLIDCNTYELAQLLPTSDKKGKEAIVAAGKFRVKENKKTGQVIELELLSIKERREAISICKQIVNEISDNEALEKEANDFLNQSIKNIDTIAKKFTDMVKVSGKAENDFNKEINDIKKAVTALVMESIKIATFPLKDLNTRSVALTKYVASSQGKLSN